MDRDIRGIDALSIFMMGLGAFLLILGPCAGFYSIAMGLVAMVACWVIAITIRVFYFGASDEHRYHYS